VAKQARITLDMDQVNGSAVMADRNQIEALFLILITNALDAVDLKGHIRVGCHTANQRIHVTIEDDGCGIDPNNLPHICEPFFTTKPVGKGTGLGLSIAATILQEHEGCMHIDSVPNQGTVVRIELPLSSRAAAPEEVSA
jgi:signal transduction histidine kinase